MTHAHDRRMIYDAHGIMSVYHSSDNLVER